MATQANPTIPTVPTDLQTFGSALATSASQLSTAGTSLSAQVQTARVSNLKRAAAAAVATYGADSQEATVANQAVTTAQAKVGQLQVVSQKASTTPPAVASDGWALHGRVYDANLNPQVRYTVFLVNAQKNYLSDYGFSYTDATGYFLLQYRGAAASGASSASKSGAASSGTSAASSKRNATSSDENQEDIGLSAMLGSSDSESSGSSSRTASASAALQAFVNVCDTSANPVLSSSTPFAPVAGQATYQVLTLSASQQSLGDPPAEIRAVAMPPAKATTTKASKKSAGTGTP